MGFENELRLRENRLGEWQRAIVNDNQLFQRQACFLVGG